MAKLSASVPPLVNTTSDGSASIERRDRRSGVVERRFGLLPEVVDARRIAELIAGRADDGLDDLGGERGRGVVVEIDTHR